MTKQEYLESIGYEESPAYRNTFHKFIKQSNSSYKVIDLIDNSYYLHCIDEEWFDTLDDLKIFENAFIEMKKDFEEMQKYE